MRGEVPVLCFPSPLTPRPTPLCTRPGSASLATFTIEGTPIDEVLKHIPMRRIGTPRVPGGMPRLGHWNLVHRSLKSVSSSHTERARPAQGARPACAACVPGGRNSRQRPRTRRGSARARRRTRAGRGRHVRFGLAHVNVSLEMRCVSESARSSGMRTNPSSNIAARRSLRPTQRSNGPSRRKRRRPRLSLRHVPPSTI